MLLPDVPILSLAIDLSDSARVYATARNDGIFRSLDGGTQWGPLNAGLGDLRGFPGPEDDADAKFFLDIAVDRTGSLLCAATLYGVLEYRYPKEPDPALVTVVEYYEWRFDHFFMTSNPDEIEALDHGILSGWVRTGLAFHAHPTPMAGTRPVCGLYNNGKGGAPNHRYTAELSVRASMIEADWTPEGFGIDAVEMCAPQ